MGRGHSPLPVGSSSAAFISCRLDYLTLSCVRHFWRTTPAVADSSKCCCTPHHRCATVQSHQPDTPRAPLATTSSTYPVQDRGIRRLPGVYRSTSSTRVARRRLPFGVQLRSTWHHDEISAQRTSERVSFRGRIFCSVTEVSQPPVVTSGIVCRVN